MRERPDVQIAAGRAKGCVDGARSYLWQTWHETEERLRQDAPLREDRLSCVAATEQAARTTQLIYDVARSAAVFEENRIERCWRDAHAIGKQFHVSHRHYPVIGRSALGLPASPFKL
jgi:alkylation response protein AidB-like acyl-CoA dehydrogenase